MNAGKVYSPEAMAILRSKMSYLSPMTRLSIFDPVRAWLARWLEGKR